MDDSFRRTILFGSLLFALGVLCGLFMREVGFGADEATVGQGHEPKLVGSIQDTSRNQRQSDTEEMGFVLPVSTGTLAEVDADQLMAAAISPFAMNDPMVFAFVNYADRATVERVTAEYAESPPSATRFGRFGVYVLAEAWARLDPAAGIAVAEKFIDPQTKGQWTEALYFTWMMRDYSAAMEALDAAMASGELDVRARNHLMSQAMLSSVGLQAGFEHSLNPAEMSDYHLREYATLLAGEDIARARAFVARVPEAKRSGVEAALLTPLAESDPMSALQAVLEMPERSRPDAIKRVYQIWATQDPAAAVAHAFSHDAPADARSQAVISWIYRDQNGAANFLRQSVSETERAIILESAFDRVGGSRRLKEMEPLLDLIPGGTARDRAVGVFLRHTFEGDPAHALRRLDLELSAGGGYTIASTLLHSQGMTDEIALEVLEKLSPGDRDRVAQSIAQMHTSNQVSDELKFQLVNGMADTNNQQWVIRSFMERVAQRNPAKAVELLSRFSPDDELAAQSYEAVAQAWAMKDPDASLAWALESEMPEKLRAGTIGRILGQIARNAPELALEKARSFDDPEMRRVSLVKMAHGLADRNPEEFAGYVKQLPPSDVSPEVYREIAVVWLEKDPLNGSKWVDGLPSGEPREQAIDGLVQSLRGSDPESAFYWAVSMQGERRKQSLRNSFSSLASKDPDAAREAFERAELSEADRKTIQRFLPKE